jgi:hypothetical protein
MPGRLSGRSLLTALARGPRAARHKAVPQPPPPRPCPVKGRFSRARPCGLRLSTQPCHAFLRQFRMWPSGKNAVAISPILPPRRPHSQRRPALAAFDAFAVAARCFNPSHPYTALASHKIAINAAARTPGITCVDTAVPRPALGCDALHRPHPTRISDVSIDNGGVLNGKLSEAMGFAV